MLHAALRSLILVALLANPLAARAGQPADDTALAVVLRFIDAYNAHDVAAMLECAHDDIQWLSIDGARVSVEADGAAALADAMRGYFAAVPSARSTIEATMAAGRFVSAWERAHFESDGQARSQAAMAVYEVVDGKILNVWYYPAQE